MTHREPYAPEVLEVLTKAREAIDEPHKWSQGAFFRNDKGVVVGGLDKATCFCAVGAIQSVVKLPSVLSRAALRTLARGIGKEAKPLYITTWNDRAERTYDDVIAAFDRAIEIAKEDLAYYETGTRGEESE